MDLIRKTSTTSTNDDVAALAREGCPHLTTVVADFQSAGRGRQGKSWIAPPGANLLFSVLLRPECDRTFWSRIPQITGMTLIEVIEEMFGQDPDIGMKWPNDLFHRDRKWGGILVESTWAAEPFAVVGVGVNCLGRSSDYPEDLRKSVTTLEQVYDRPEIVPQDILDHFRDRFSRQIDGYLSDFDPVIRFANRRDALFGRQVTVESRNDQVEGTASGIGANGELIIEGVNGERTLISSGSVLAIE